MKKIQLNIGCGIHHFKGFINVDKFITKEFLEKEIASKDEWAKNIVIEKGSEFVQADVCKLPFKDNFADYIESIDMIEHLPMREVQRAFNEMCRVLKPGGKMCIFTTNFDGLAQQWVDTIKDKEFDEVVYIDLAEVIYGNQHGPGNFHTVPINPAYANKLLQKAGFKSANLGLYPRGINQLPPLKTQKANPLYGLRSDCLYIEAFK